MVSQMSDPNNNDVSEIQFTWLLFETNYDRRQIETSSNRMLGFTGWIYSGA